VVDAVVVRLPAHVYYLSGHLPFWLHQAGMIVFALPGSTGAARLALTRLILPELGHAVREITR
jgi:molybdopterin biosynthesis enzyme MoaB